MSDIQSGIFYPISIIFLLIPFPLAFNIFVVLHLILGFCFFYLFIVSLGLSRKSAMITAISYCFGGYIFAAINTLNNLTTAIWLPAILWSFNRAAKKSDKTGYVLTIFFLSAAILGGEPQLFLLMAATFFLYVIVYDPQKGNGNAHKLRSGATVFFLGVWATAIAFVQLGPTYLDYQFSVRLGGLPYQEASKYSLSWEMLKHFFLPLHFSEGFSTDTHTLRNFFPNQGNLPWLLTIYPGIIIFPMAILGAICSFSKKRTLIWPIIFLISVVLALGNNMPVHHLFYKVLPIFRFPEKFVFTAGFSLLVMSAYGFDALFKKVSMRKIRATIVLCFLALALTLDLVSNNRNLNPFWNTDFYSYHHSALQPIIDDPELFRVFADRMPRPHGIQNSINNSHIKWQMMLLPNLGIVNNLYHVGGLPALELRYQHLITEILKKPWKEKIRFLELANVKYIISQEQLDQKPELNGRIQKINGLVYMVKNFLPRAWVVGNVKKFKNGQIHELTETSFEPSKFALGPDSTACSPNKHLFGKVEQVFYGKSNEIQVETNTKKRGILIVSESSYPGWEVFVDGQKEEILWLDLLFQGVDLEPGKHSILFKFRPRNFSLFLSISLLSSSILFALWAFFKIRKGFKPHPYEAPLP